jgi:hypothetical protein
VNLAAFDRGCNDFGAGVYTIVLQADQALVRERLVFSNIYDVQLLDSMHV